MKRLLVFVLVMFLFVFAGCGGDDGENGDDHSNTGNTGDTGDTGDSGDTGNTGTGGGDTIADKGENYVWSEVSSRSINWEDAISYCENLDQDGHVDWKLPTIGQLRSLIVECPGTIPGGTCKINDSCLELSCRDPECMKCPVSGDGKYSKLGLTGTIWSGSEIAEGSTFSGTHAWYVYFLSGSIDYHHKDTINDVICVRF